MDAFLQHLVNGISLGSIYALIALGYTMVYGILQLINFAHADVYMLGAFLGFYSTRWLHLDNANGTPAGYGAFFLLLVIAMVGCGIIGLVIERLAYRPLRSAPKLNALITAIGVSLFIEYTGQIVFGTTPQVFPALLKDVDVFTFGEARISKFDITIFSTSVMLMFALRHLILNTSLGRAMRAVSYNSTWASLMGISVDRIISMTFVIGSALAGAAGILVSIKYPRIDPLMGVMIGLKAFIAAVLGGIGNIAGAVMGAMFIGIAEEFVIGYGSSTYRDALSFGILILVLLVRPSGLLGRPAAEKV